MDDEKVAGLSQKVLDEGIDAGQAINQGLIHGLE